MNAIKLYRVANKLHLSNIPIVPKVIKGLIFIIYNSVVPFDMQIGKGSKLAYGGIGVVLHSKAIIGRKVIIGTNVTIGRKLKPLNAPVVGDNVYIATGSKILGDVKIGSNVIIGANSVVINDIPSDSIAVGSPAKVVRKLNRPISEIFENL